jgi:long-chain acyl-CoA synthetase
VTLLYAYATTLELLEDAARRHPDAEAVVCGDERLNYADYLRCVRAFASELRALTRSGDRVVLLMGNSFDVAIAIFAAQAAETQVTPLNPAFTAHELSAILEDATPSVIVFDRAAQEVVDAALSLWTGERPHLIEIGGRRLTDPSTSIDAAGMPRPDPDSIAALQYTGGTTGRSKGVELTHRRICLNIAQREAVLPTLDGTDRVLCVAPLFHVYAIAMCLYLAANCGGMLVILPRYRPDWAVVTLRKERITLFAGNPTIYKSLLGFDGFADATFPDLRLCYSGSAALPEETLRRWETVTGVPICEGYGQTEAGAILTYNPAEGLRKPGSAGPVLPGIELRIVNPDTPSTVLPTGEIGEIIARSPAVMRGYRGQLEATEQALRDGWLHTGDLGYLDEDGYLFIKDRLKDLVISGGFNVYPREIEELLHAHPDIAEAGVIGVADDYLGEVLRAYVVPRHNRPLDENDLAAYCAENLVKYKRPRGFRILSSLPKTAAGKIDKKALASIQ